MYNVIELKLKDGVPSYGGGQFPYGALYDSLNATYVGWSRDIIEFPSQVPGIPRSEVYDIYRFESEAGDIICKKHNKVHNTLTDALDMHKHIPGVRYRLKAIIGPQLDADGKPFGNAKEIYRLIRFDKLTRNPESCKVK